MVLCGAPTAGAGQGRVDQVSGDRALVDSSRRRIRQINAADRSDACRNIDARFPICHIAVEASKAGSLYRRKVMNDHGPLPIQGRILWLQLWLVDGVTL